MSLTIHSRVAGMFSNKRSEKDVTVRVVGEDGKDQLTHGFIVELGALVEGCALDPEPEFELEYGRPELKLTLLNYSGSVKSVKAWLSTVDGPQTVFEQQFAEPVALTAGESLEIVGPAF